jgi:hypothetical protein
VFFGLKLAGRLGAMVLGLIGALVALITTLGYVAVHNIYAAANSGASLDSVHWQAGLALTAVGALGAILSLLFPRLAAFFMLVATLGLFWPLGLYAVPASVLLALGTLLAYIDRTVHHDND